MLDHRHLESGKTELVLAEIVEDARRRNQYVGLGAIEAGNGGEWLESVRVVRLGTAVVLQMEEPCSALKSGV